jgi:hypothetical protein
MFPTIENIISTHVCSDDASNFAEGPSPKPIIMFPIRDE